MTSNQLKYWELAESRRANKARESENIRSNLAKEGLTTRQLVEGSRHNRAAEAETYRSNLARESETHRANVQNELLATARNAETERSNRASEVISSRKNDIAQQQVGATQYSADKRFEGTKYSANKQAQSQANQLKETIRANKQKELIGYLGEANKLLSTVAKTSTDILKGGSGRETTTRELIERATNPKYQKSYW